MTEEDCLRRFLFERLGIRGEWVKLNNSWQEAKSHQQAPQAGLQLLGQALAAVTLLSATVKFKGSLILQAQGEGDVKTLVAQATDEHKIRGLIRCNEHIATGSLTTQFGHGRLVLTIESENAAPYQGIVPLHGRHLADALETYFDQSEQLNTRLWLYANDEQAVGLLIQELPSHNRSEEDWERVSFLAETVTERELMALDAEGILFRLFNEEEVRVFDAEPVAFECSCSRQKIDRTLRSMGREELESVLAERGLIEVTCEFCSRHYAFDKIDVETLLSEEGIGNDSSTRH